MSYVRLLRLPPQSGDIGSTCWRRHLSARSSSSTRAEHGRDASNAWQHQRLRASSSCVLSEVGGNDVLGAAAQSVVGRRCFNEVGMSWKGVVGKNTTGASATRPTTAALTAAGRLQIDPAQQRRGLLLRSTPHSRDSLPFRGALRTGWDHGVGGTGLQWQSLRAFASAPPEPASKTDSPNRTATRPGLRTRASLGDLLKPSDVSAAG